MKKYAIALLAVAMLWNCKKENADDKTVADSNSDTTEQTVTNSDGTTSTIEVSDNSNQNTNTTTRTAENPEADDIAMPMVDDPTVSAPTLAPNKGIQAASDGTYRFSYNLEVGKSYPMRLTTDISTSATDGKETIKEKSKAVQKRAFKVKSKKGQNYIIEVKDENRSEKITLPNGQSISYNTAGAKPSDEQIAFNYEMARIEEQNPLTIEMAPTGNILSVSGLSSRKSKILAKFKSKIKDAKQYEQVKKNIDATYVDRVVIAELEKNLVDIFPKRKIKVGDKWTDSDSKSEGGNSMSFNNNYEFKSVANNQVTLVSKGTLKTKGSQSNEQASMASNGTQNSSSKVIFNQTTGWIESLNVTQKEVTKQTIQAQGEKQNMTITTTTKISLN